MSAVGGGLVASYSVTCCVLWQAVSDIHPASRRCVVTEDGGAAMGRVREHPNENETKKGEAIADGDTTVGG